MKKSDKLFIVRTYVKARTAAEAIRKSRTQAPDDVYVDDDWRKGQNDRLASAIGFVVPTEEDE